MSQNQAGKWARRVAWCTLAAILPIGCNPFATYSHSSGPPESAKAADYPLVLKDGPKKGKEVMVAVFASITPEIRKEFEGSEDQLVSDTAKKLQEMAQENKQEQKLAVLDPTLVNKFKKKNPEWNRMHPSQWGRNLDVDYVLDIHLDKMSLYQPGSHNAFYEGQAEATVETYAVSAGIAEPKYKYVLPFRYPGTGVLDANSISVIRFRQDFMEHLAAELAMKHATHKEGSGIANNR